MRHLSEATPVKVPVFDKKIIRKAQQFTITITESSIWI